MCVKFNYANCQIFAQQITFVLHQRRLVTCHDILCNRAWCLSAREVLGGNEMFYDIWGV